MNEEGQFSNDFDRISDRIEDAILSLVGSLRESTPGDCSPVNDKQFLSAIVQLKHLHGWTEGLADTHRKAAIRKSEVREA